MEFREVKEFCKHAGPGVCCPATFKNCNKDNCPMVRDENDCGEHCPLVKSLKDKVEELKEDYNTIYRNVRALENDLKKTIVEYTKTIQDAAMDMQRALEKDLDRDLDL